MDGDRRRRPHQPGGNGNAHLQSGGSVAAPYRCQVRNRLSPSSSPPSCPPVPGLSQEGAKRRVKMVRTAEGPCSAVSRQ
jgi:hypothetical protein